MNTEKKPHFINVANMNQSMVKADCAIIGATVRRAGEIVQDMASGKSYPFKEIQECNTGNPQALGQTPITFARQVMSCLMSPELINGNTFPEGVRKRAQYYKDRIKGSIGAYSQSSGFRFVRENVAKYLEARDGVPSNWENVMLTEGATAGITMVLSALLAQKNSGIMLPVPQYPLYGAIVTLGEGQQVPYYLHEESGWQVSINDLAQSYEKASRDGIKVRAIVVINPGNPTGQVLEEETMKQIVEFAYNNDLCILADEVYQQNIWSDKKKFVSFKKVIHNMPSPYNKAPVFSFGSCSKGFHGECGMRGGFLETFNVDKEVDVQLHKYKTISLCNNTIGQVMIDLVVNPPSVQENGKEVYEQFCKERDSVLASLKRKATVATKTFNSMKNVECQEIEGALYAFPKIKLTQRAIQEAKKRNIAPDLLYCLEGLNATGMITVEGTGFGQRDGSYHFRTTLLITPDEKFEDVLERFKKFNDAFHEKYSDVKTPRPRL